MKTQVYIDYDSRDPAGIRVRMNVNGDMVDYQAVQEKSEHWLHARVAIAQAVGLGMLWPPGAVAVVAAVGDNGDGRAILAHPMLQLEKVGAGVVLGNVAQGFISAVAPAQITESRPE